MKKDFDGFIVIGVLCIQYLDSLIESRTTVATNTFLDDIVIDHNFFKLYVPCAKYVSLV